MATMTSERWRVVKQVLASTLELDPSDRPAYLADTCGDDVETRTEVELLLPHGDDDAFLEAPAIGVAPPVPAGAIDTQPLVTGVVDAVRPGDLPPYTELRLKTKRSDYRIVIVAPLDQSIIVQGGSRFPEPARARFHRQEEVLVGQELKLLVGSRVVTTTPICSIEVRASAAGELAAEPGAGGAPLPLDGGG